MRPTILAARVACPVVVLAAWVFACGSDTPGGGQGTSEDGGLIADGGSAPDVGTGAEASGQDSAAGADGGDARADAGPWPPDPCVEAGTCPVGAWIDVTPSTMPASVLSPTPNAFGPGSVVTDPARPSDLYVGPNGGLWKSTDYGFTWQLINDKLQDAPRGVIIAVAGTTPATVWSAGYNVLFKSTDGGKNFQSINLNMSLYSLKVDPYDSNHLISGLHEADGIAESTDGGATWNMVGGAGFPSGGISWYPYFVDTGNAATTRGTWFAIAQNGASAITTGDAGGHWTTPTGIAGLQHPHGNSQIFQSGSTLFVAGVNGPGSSQGVYRSTDLGVSWSQVDKGMAPEALVWGTPKNVYAMYAWACSDCNLGTNYEISPQPGAQWSQATVPAQLVIGPNSVGVTYDGTHYVFVAVMWAQGIWRYVEP
jgi:hypothetical protein